MRGIEKGRKEGGVGGWRKGRKGRWVKGWRRERKEGRCWRIK